MTLSLDPTIRELDGCSCCQGTGRQTPEVIENRPGLSAIAYRCGTHSRFKASMLARLSAVDVPALNGLTTRADDDFTIAMFDAWASVADVLTFYQERIANEAYTRTATERRSLVELANLVGYIPRTGVAASAYLAFTLDDTGLPDDVPVPLGTQVQSIPGPGERPQVFETIEEISGRTEWNEIRPRLTQKHPSLTAETKRVTVLGAAVGVNKGDSMLLICGAAASDRVVKRVLAVTTDTVAQTTTIDLAEDPPDPPPLIFTLLPLAIWQPTPTKLTAKSVATNVLSGSWKHADLKAYAAVQKWSLPKLSAHLFFNVLALLKVLPAETGVFAFRRRASIFGHNAPNWYSLPATQRLSDYVTGSDGHLVPKSPPYPTSWEARKLSQDPGGGNRQIDLDTTAPGIVKGSWLVLEDQYRRDVYKVEDNAEVSRADFTLSAKVSRIKLSSSSNFGSYGMRNTSVLAESEKLELAELPIVDSVKGNRIVLDRAYLGLTAGRPVVVSGKRVDLPGVSDREVVLLADVLFSEGFTELVLATSLAHEYQRSTVTINANVALASHGESKDQALGGGDGSTPFQTFTLLESPLTYVPSKGPTGAATTLSVRVNELLWQEVDFLYGRGPNEQVYITRTDDSGRTHVTFGDGRTGARVPSGLENVRATYRKGLGAEGLVHEDQLSLLATKPLGVRSVTNPVDASDAADPDGPDALRRNAALPIHTLNRIVSLQDYEDFARAFTGVAKALATWTWDGHHRGVFVTVGGLGGNAIPDGSLTYNNLLFAMRAAGDDTVPLRIKTFTPAYFRIAAALSVDPAYESDAVLAAVEAALRTAFGYDSRDFGQPVAKSEVVATMQAVPGVVAVDLNDLQRVDAAAGEPTLADRLAARLPRTGTNVTVAAELLLLDPRPVQLGVLAS